MDHGRMVARSDLEFCVVTASSVIGGNRGNGDEGMRGILEASSEGSWETGFPQPPIVLVS